MGMSCSHSWFRSDFPSFRSGRTDDVTALRLFAASFVNSNWLRLPGGWQLSQAGCRAGQIPGDNKLSGVIIP